MIFTFVLLCLATWRLCSLLAREDGPWDVFAELRHRMGVAYDENSDLQGDNVFAKAIICSWCSSLYISPVGAYLMKPINIGEFIVYWLAISAGAILIDTVVMRD